MNLENIFEEVSRQMLSDFEKAKSALSHAGLKGGSNEEIVKIFLRQYLPKTLDISSGLVVDSKGGISKQLDIIIHDSAKTPIFYQSAETRVIPIECVYAVIEVKACLDKTELGKSFQNMRSVKNLQKLAFFESVSPIIESKNLYGKSWRNWPIAYFVFAFDSPNLESVLPNIEELNTNTLVHQRIDSVCIMSKGVILNQNPKGMLTALPDQSTRLVASHTKKPLLFFYTLISIILNQADMNSFNIHAYLGDIKF